MQSLCNTVAGLFVPLPSKSQTCKCLALQPGTRRAVHLEQKKKKKPVVFMWAGFGNTLHAYILMIFGLGFFGTAADAKSDGLGLGGLREGLRVKPVIR